MFNILSGLLHDYRCTLCFGHCCIKILSALLISLCLFSFSTPFSRLCFPLLISLSDSRKPPLSPFYCPSFVFPSFQLPLSSLFPFVHASLPSDSQIKKTLSPQTVGKNSFLSSFSFFCLFPFNSPALCSLFVHDSLLPPPSPIPDQEELISFFPFPRWLFSDKCIRIGSAIRCRLVRGILSA